MPNGWPLGLGNLNMRLRVTESLHPAATEPHPLHTPSSSCSSFSSSNLDTESTASFFQDHSVSLGRLIGIRSRERGSVYFPNASRFEQRESLSERRSCLDVPGEHGEEMCQGVCVPLLVTILVKMSRSRSNSRR
ncbi:hypothetical protein HYC85_018456 [Camellia sinensis]|uniref:Uncharacterized protein n=1 Tax=Camellia sinensis TaxID=4442 RepID=A0A7J7GUC9_CAMSI|nr:hypothetical protein HYC85_018456 [Camellia sinensis]